MIKGNDDTYSSDLDTFDVIENALPSPGHGIIEEDEGLNALPKKKACGKNTDSETRKGRCSAQKKPIQDARNYDWYLNYPTSNRFI